MKAMILSIFQWQSHLSITERIQRSYADEPPWRGGSSVDLRTHYFSMSCPIESSQHPTLNGTYIDLKVLSNLTGTSKKMSESHPSSNDGSYFFIAVWVAPATVVVADIRWISLD